MSSYQVWAWCGTAQRKGDQLSKVPCVSFFFHQLFCGRTAVSPKSLDQTYWGQWKGSHWLQRLWAQVHSLETYTEWMANRILFFSCSVAHFFYCLMGFKVFTDCLLFSGYLMSCSCPAAFHSMLRTQWRTHLVHLLAAAAAAKHSFAFRFPLQTAFTALTPVLQRSWASHILSRFSYEPILLWLMWWLL